MSGSQAAPLWLARGEHSLPDHDRWLSRDERARARTLVFTKRRVEFLVARWALKNAVAVWTGRSTEPESVAGVEAWPAPTGAPRLYVDGCPSDIPVSLSDRAGWAICLLGAGGTPVGVDLELVEPRTDAFVSDWFTDAERAAIVAADRDLAANLVWSAKESALKVMQTGLRRDTRSVEVSVDDVVETAQTWRRLSVRSREGPTYPGWWRRYGEFIVTVCTETEVPQPRSLERRPALDDAAPVHSWLRAPRVQSGSSRASTAIIRSRASIT